MTVDRDSRWPLVKRSGRFTYLMWCVIVLLVVTPMIGNSALGGIGNQVLVTAVLASGVFAVSRRRRDLVIAVCLMVPALGVGWVGEFLTSAGLTYARYGFLIAFSLFLAATTLRHVLADERVTGDTIAGAVSVYLVVGFAFAVAYSLTEFAAPGSIAVGSQLAAAGNSAEDPRDFAQMIYFSFVTLATLGYGDISPVSATARTLTCAEAVFGQLYLAVLVARLVGLRIAGSATADAAPGAAVE